MATVQAAEGTIPVPPATPQPPAARPSPRLQLRCLGCGYGAVAQSPIECPMCGGETWDFAEWRPFRSQRS